MVGINEPFIECLHALTHGNPISVRILGLGLEKIFQVDMLLVRAEMELYLFTVLICRRVLSDSFPDIWASLASANNRPVQMKEQAEAAFKRIK
ncbi:MAG: hypothetical protein WBD87_06160 [Candidatus Acidiferrales bacterium]